MTISESLVERLTGEPENVIEQLRAMAALQDASRQMHRFDEYLLAAANIIEAALSEHKSLPGGLS
jgi:membrane glycosyltransferase